MKRLSSLRTTLAPMPSIPMCLPPGVLLRRKRPSTRGNVLVESYGTGVQLFRGLRDLHPARGIQHRLDDVMVAGAAADVAFELMAHGGLIQRAVMAVYDVDRRHDHARGAEAALQAVI